MCRLAMHISLKCIWVVALLSPFKVFIMIDITSILMSLWKLMRNTSNFLDYVIHVLSFYRFFVCVWYLNEKNCHLRYSVFALYSHPNGKLLFNINHPSTKIHFIQLSTNSIISASF